MIELLPEPKAQRWRTFVDEIYAKNQREGSQAVQTEFMASNLVHKPLAPLHHFYQLKELELVIQLERFCSLLI